MLQLYLLESYIGLNCIKITLCIGLDYSYIECKVWRLTKIKYIYYILNCLIFEILPPQEVCMDAYDDSAEDDDNSVINARIVSILVLVIVVFMLFLAGMGLRKSKDYPPIPEQQVFSTIAVFNGGVELQDEDGERAFYKRSALDEKLPSMFYIRDHTVVKVNAALLELEKIPAEQQGKYML